MPAPSRPSRARGPFALVVTGLLVGLAGCGTPGSDAAGAPASSPTAPGSGSGTPSAVTVTVTPTPSGTSAPATETPATPVTPAGPQTGPSGVVVSAYGPDVDAPGALVQMVTTARGVATGEEVIFAIDLDGTPGTCEGGQWRHAGGLSQKCWVTMPARTGRGTVHVSATVRSSAGWGRTAVGAYGVTASGPLAHAPSAADRDRITRCGNTTDQVWLTFDDGFESTAAMHAVVDTLTAHHVRGRFFGTGAWARSNPGMVAEIRRQGHLVENHTSDHLWLNTLGDAALRAQIAGGPGGDAPRLLRPGYGGGAYTDRVVTAAGALGYQVCYWTVDPRDWAGPDADLIVTRVMQGDEKTPPVAAGGIVLLHMPGAHTAAALPKLIAAIRARGLTLEPLP